MNHQMWLNAATQHNIDILRQRGVRILGPAEGDQACGEVGPGRMLEPLDLVVQAEKVFMNDALAGRHVLITAGPTWEALDPVRGLSNHSSGKMGYAIAAAAREAGAQVTLVSGPTQLSAPQGVSLVPVVSAQEMHDAVQSTLAVCAPPVDVFIGVAAVADYRPLLSSEQKIKKSAESLSIQLVRNPDVLTAVAAHEHRPYTVGFAAETQNLEQNAREKLVAKGVDLIAANKVGEGLGFAVDNNALLLVERVGTTELPYNTKEQLARALVAHVASRINAKNTSKDTRRAHR